MKKIFVLFALTVLIPAAFNSCSVKDLIRQKEKKTVCVRVLSVSSGPALLTANYVGRVEPSKSAVVLSQAAGTIDKLNVTEGRTVLRGDVLATVESEMLRSSYEISKAALKQAEDGYERVSRVYGTGSVSEVKMVEIRTQLEKARAAESAARKALEDCTVRAPFSGVIGEVYCHAGEKVTLAAPMVKILDAAEVEIHFNVPESEYASISQGTATVVEIPALKKSVRGTVAVKGITASPLSHSYDFTIKGISDASSLIPGMVCKVRIESGAGKSIVIPASAVRTDMDGRFVWCVSEDDRVRKVYVTAGGFADKGIIISEGLSEGDRVITEGSRKVSGGMKVKVEE